ncbi:MAG: hypothetical protein GY854_19855 [Deltaproteobacteria bacterium]|nr:hypothetical protein [Deltaproteobacteria bacterium]
MSAYTGPTPAILATVTIPDTNTNAMTAFRALGNSVRLRVTTVTGGCVSLTFTAEVSKDGTTYYDVIDRDSVWSFVSTVPTTAGTYDLEMEGLAVVPGEMVRLSYKAATASGTLAVTAICWENPKGGGISVSVPDVVVDVGNIDVNLEALEHAEDVAHSSGDSGIMSLGVRNDTLAALGGTDGDYAPLQVDANGALYTTGSTVQVDDAAFTPGTSSITMAGFEFDDTTPDSVDEGDGGAARMSANRNQYMTIRDAAGNERGVNVTAANQLEVAATPSIGSNRVVTNATGTGSGTLATTAHSAAANLKAVTIKLDGALAAAETLTVQIDANDGAAYDANLRVYDMGTAGTTSWTWLPEVAVPLESGDEVLVSLSANTNTRTYGLRIVADKV